MENIQILLKQGAVGKPCEAIVKVGDRVNRGALIATPTGLGANVHSSVTGEVVEINDEMIVWITDTSSLMLRSVSLVSDTTSFRLKRILLHLSEESNI